MHKCNIDFAELCGSTVRSSFPALSSRLHVQLRRRKCTCLICKHYAGGGGGGDFIEI